MRNLQKHAVTLSVNLLHLAAVLLLLAGCNLPGGAAPTSPNSVPRVTPSSTSALAPPSIATMPGAAAPALPTRDPTQPEMRAFWVDAFHSGIKSPQQVDQLLSDLQSVHANAVFVQVRKRGDAYYNITLEPRSSELGSQPDFDPLAYLIEKAHAAQPPIEVHAWMVVMPIARAGELPADPQHIFNQHGPDAPAAEQWITFSADGATTADNNYYLDPGHPAAAQYLVNVLTNVVRAYDVDGLHLDYIRYAGRQWGYNPLSVERFQRAFGSSALPEPNDPAWQQWRRDQVTHLVRQVYLETIALKPEVKLSAAVIAWGAGPTSQAEWLSSRTLTDALQDWSGWMEEGILDLAVPMNYDREADASQRRWFDQWIEWEKEHTAGRQLVIGLGAYLNDTEGTLAQLQRALAPSASGFPSHGVSFYSYASPGSAGTSWHRFSQDLTGTFFQTWVPVPVMPWKAAPRTGYLKGTAVVRGSPADGARVILSGPVEAVLEVSGSGFFGSVGLPPGKYRAELTYQGEVLASASVLVEAGGLASLDLR